MCGSVTPTPVHWSPTTRLAFRCTFLYFLCFAFCYGNGTIFQVIPWVGNHLEVLFDWPLNRLSEWSAAHLFHLSGLGATFHPTGSGDTAVQWVQQFVFLFVALAGGLVWTLIATVRGTRRTEYQTLYAWLRFLLRLTTGMFMLSYGLDKLFPLQMAPISIAILNEPVGQSSPMTLLWSLIGMNPGYEMVCGAAEVIGGTLILFRRTALAGALLSAFVMLNVLLYNMFFDVPVKLFAANLLAALLFIILPDLRALYAFFWHHTPAAPAGIWVPPARRRAFRIATRTIELAFTAAFLLVMPYRSSQWWKKVHAATKVHSPLLGAWHLDPAHLASGAFLDPEKEPITDLYVDTVLSGFSRSTHGELWRTSLELDEKTGKVTITCYVGKPVTYDWRMPDLNHLILASTPPESKPPVSKPLVSKSAEPNHTPQAHSTDAKPGTVFTPTILTLTRTAIPSHYPLLDRGFHWVNEWGLER